MAVLNAAIGGGGGVDDGEVDPVHTLIRCAGCVRLVADMDNR